MKSSTLEAVARLSSREHLLIMSNRGTTMGGSPDKLAALVDLVRALDRLRATHAVVGGEGRASAGDQTARDRRHD